MQNDYRDIAEKIRSGAYYREGLQWYHTVYHSPIAERCFCVLVALVAVVTISLNVQAFFGIASNLRPDVPLVLRMEWDGDKVPVLKRLAQVEENANAALLRYFLAEYVQMREGYAIDSLQRHYQRVRALSADSEFDRFRNYLDLQNPESPIVRFERHTRRDIVVVSVEMNDKVVDGTPRGQATIVFQASLERGGEILETALWRATIAFAYKSLTVNQEKDGITPMEFQVLEYSAAPVRDE